MRSHDRPNATCIWPARPNPRTQAEALQRQAETRGIETLSHKERGQVACRALQYGWEPAWEWFERQYGADFKPEVTWREFRNRIEEWPED